MTERKTVKPFPAEVRARAVRMLREHRHEQVSEWAALQSIASKIGCTAATLRSWIRQAERDEGARPGLTTDERERLKGLEARFTSCGRQTRSCARPVPISRRRSSTARSRNDGVHASACG